MPADKTRQGANGAYRYNALWSRCAVWEGSVSGKEASRSVASIALVSSAPLFAFWNAMTPLSSSADKAIDPARVKTPYAEYLLTSDIRDLVLAEARLAPSGVQRGKPDIRSRSARHHRPLNSTMAVRCAPACRPPALDMPENAATIDQTRSSGTEREASGVGKNYVRSSARRQQVAHAHANPGDFRAVPELVLCRERGDRARVAACDTIDLAGLKRW